VAGTRFCHILRGTTVSAIVDDVASWEVAKELLLDGFQYSRFLDAYVRDEPGPWIHHDSLIDATCRIAWLDRQRKEDLQLNFKPQPWEQLIKVLREMGHQEGAKKVAIAKQARICKSTRISALAHWLYGISCRYGYQPGWLILWAIGAALLWAGLFKVGAVYGVMAPADRHMVEEVRDIACRPEHGGNWTKCASLHRRGYPSFDPFVYSFDLILPVIATQQTKDWAPLTTVPCRDVNVLGLCKQRFSKAITTSTSGYWPSGLFFWLMARAETLLGWFVGLWFVAIVSGIIKKD
jgi:hypothetical protein